MREQVAGVVPDGVQQVGLAQPGVAVDEQRVVRLGRRLGDRDGRGVGEPVARADDEGVEGVLRVQPGQLDLLGHLGVGAGAPGAGHLDETGAGGVVGAAGGIGGAVLGHVAGEGRGLGAVDLVLTDVEVVDLAAAVGGPQVVALVARGAHVERGGLGQRGVDGDGEAHVAAELAAQGRGDPVAQPGLDDVLGEVVRHGDQGGVVEQADELGERQERPLLHRDPVGVEDLEGRAPQLGHRRVRHSRPHPSRCPPGPSSVPGLRDRYPVHMVVHRLWVCRVVAGGVSCRVAGRAP